MNKEVSLPLAKLLKEKGYNKSCYHYYYNNELESSSRDNWNAYSNGYSAPTIAEVVMWFYEKHGIWIEVTTDVYGKFCWLVKELKASKNNFNSPTEAYEAAIEHILNNLI